VRTIRLGATRLGSKQEGGGQAEYAGFDEAYSLHSSAIHNYAFRMLGRAEDAEDLTVLVFEKALRAWDRRPVDAELRPWLFRIATNSAIDELRRRKLIQWRPWETFVGLFHPAQVAPDSPEREALRGETISLVRAALAELSPRDQAALILREHQGLSVEEIAKALGISHGAAKVALFRARERLRESYLKLGGEPSEPERAPGG
jgi:RNA polymerase sigma-70 factor, ECF subfamily